MCILKINQIIKKTNLQLNKIYKHCLLTLFQQWFANKQLKMYFNKNWTPLSPIYQHLFRKEE